MIWLSVYRVKYTIRMDLCYRNMNLMSELTLQELLVSGVLGLTSSSLYLVIVYSVSKVVDISFIQYGLSI